ncbi:hypothetical protein ACB092_05G083300 [Castanea dentata]
MRQKGGECRERRLRWLRRVMGQKGFFFLPRSWVLAQVDKSLAYTGAADENIFQL